MTKMLFPFTRTSLANPLLDEFDKFFNEFANSFGSTIKTQQGKNQRGTNTEPDKRSSGQNEHGCFINHP